MYCYNIGMSHKKALGYDVKVQGEIPFAPSDLSRIQEERQLRRLGLGGADRTASGNDEEEEIEQLDVYKSLQKEMEAKARRDEEEDAGHNPFAYLLVPKPKEPDALGRALADQRQREKMRATTRKHRENPAYRERERQKKKAYRAKGGIH